MGRRRHSVKKRRQWLVQQKGRGLFQGLHEVLCQCVSLNVSRHGKTLIGSINITCCDTCRALEDHGRGLHDFLTRTWKQLISILQRRTYRKCLVEQSRDARRQKTCVVSQPSITPSPGQCSNQTVESRINQINQTYSSNFPGGVGVGAPGGPPGEEEEEAGDLVTGPVEQWLKRMIKGSPSTPKPPITPATKKGKGAATTSKIPIVKKGSPSTSRGDLQSRLEAVRERRKTWEKHLAESGFTKGKGKGKGPAREVERLKTLTRVGRLVPRQKVTTSIGLRRQ